MAPPAASAGPLLAAFALGLPRPFRWARGRSGPSVSAESDRRAPRNLGRLRAGPQAALAVAFVLLVAVNLLLTPADPAIQNQGWGGAYRVSYLDPPGYSSARELASLVPPTAAVLATDNLFPLVANDPNAYSLIWQADPVLALPFNGTHLPTYVHLAESRTYAMPPWLDPRLYDPSSYGVRGVAWSTIAGTLLLFEEGYRAAPTHLGRPPALGTLSPRQLVDADAGILVPTPGTSFGEVALNPLGALGTIWFGPQISLAPGNYSVTVTLRADPAPGFSPPGPGDPVIWIGAGAFGLPEFYGYANPFGSVSGPGWSTVAFHFQVPAPVIQFSVQGVALDPSAEISLEQVELVPTA